VVFIKFILASNQISGLGKCSANHEPNTGLTSYFTISQMRV